MNDVIGYRGSVLYIFNAITEPYKPKRTVHYLSSQGLPNLVVFTLKAQNPILGALWRLMVTRSNFHHYFVVDHSSIHVPFCSVYLNLQHEKLNQTRKRVLCC